MTAVDAVERTTAALRLAWSRVTADPVDQATWSPENPAWGQCGSTALIVQDRHGGELLLSEVHAADGGPAGVHYANRLPDGRTLDLTREQFRAGERVGPPRVVARAPDVTRGRLPGQYHLLAARVARALAGEPVAPGDRPVSIKAVCPDGRGRVLLCRNDRDEWELPGGRPEVGEEFSATLVRELDEETGLAVDVDRLLGVRSLEVLPSRWVDVVAFAAEVRPGGEGAAPRVSDEHFAVAWVDVATLAAAGAPGSGELPEAYRALIAAAGAASR